MFVLFPDRVQNNWVAYNMHGLLLEHQKLFRTAAQVFEKYVLGLSFVLFNYH